MRVRMLLVLVASSIAACGGGTDTRGTPLCVPNHQVACTCPDRSSGVQRCLASGNAVSSQGGAGGGGGIVSGGTGGIAAGGSGGVAAGGSGAIGAGGSGAVGAGGAGAVGVGGSGAATVDPACSAAPNCASAPEEASGAPAGTSTSPTVLVVRKLYLGDQDRTGQPSILAWRDLGFDLDGIVSSKLGANHCRPVSGANPASVKTDGNGGVDNSFGANLLPLLLALSASASQDANDAISRGDTSLLLSIDHLDAALAQSAVGGRSFLVTRGGTAPLWSGADPWTSYPSTLAALTPGYVTGGVWVGRASSRVVVEVALGAGILALPIDRAVIAGRVLGTGASASIGDGVIAGVMATEALVNVFQVAAGSIDATLCEVSTFDAVALQIRAASDIMTDGSNGDATVSCNAISIGIGFSASAALQGATAIQPIPPDPCK